MSRLVRELELASQVGARRNALIASTALAQRRADLNEVEDWFARRHPVPALPVTAATALPPARVAGGSPAVDDARP
jgi:hypothetical protein